MHAFRDFVSRIERLIPGLVGFRAVAPQCFGHRFDGHNAHIFFDGDIQQPQGIALEIRLGKQVRIDRKQNRVKVKPCQAFSLFSFGIAMAYPPPKRAGD